MDDKRDIIEELKSFKDQITISGSETEKAERVAEELYGNSGRLPEGKAKGGIVVLVRKRGLLWIVAFLLCCIIFLSIFLPIYLRHGTSSNIIYYNGNQVERKIIDDIDVFVAENNLTCHFYGGTTLKSNYYAGYVIESQQLVFVRQEAMALVENGFDSFMLSAVLTQDKFQEFEDFSNFTDSLITSERIEVRYKIVTINQVNYIYATYQESSIIYNLQITTLSNSFEALLEQYIQQIQ